MNEKYKTHWQERDHEGFDCIGGKKPHFECCGKNYSQPNNDVSFVKLCAWFTFICCCVAVMCFIIKGAL